MEQYVESGWFALAWMGGMVFVIIVLWWLLVGRYQ